MEGRRIKLFTPGGKAITIRSSGILLVLTSGLKYHIGESVEQQLYNPIVKDVPILIFLLHLELLYNRMYVIGAGLYECGWRLRSIRRHFKDTGTHP